MQFTTVDVLCQAARHIGRHLCRIPAPLGDLSRDGDEDEDEIVRIRQSKAKSGEWRSKILEGLLVYEVRSEIEGELLPRVWSSAAQHEVSYLRPPGNGHSNLYSAPILLIIA